MVGWILAAFGIVSGVYAAVIAWRSIGDDAALGRPAPKARPAPAGQPESRPVAQRGAEAKTESSASPERRAAAGAAAAREAHAAASTTYLPPRDDQQWRPALRAECDPGAVGEFQNTLPVLPIVAARILNALEDARTDPRAIARIVGTDPSLAARIFMIVNSAFFGLAKKTGDLKRAVVLLGYSQIKGIVFRSVLNQTLPGAGHAAGELDRLWERCYLLSVAAPTLAQQLNVPVSQSLSTAALFLDVGKIALLARRSSAAAEVYGAGLLDDRRVARAEEERFGLNHGIAGGILAETWNLPPAVVSLIECHLVPHFWAGPFLEGEAMRGIALLHLSEAIVDRFTAERALEESGGVEESGNPVIAPWEPEPFYFHVLGAEPPLAPLMTDRMGASLRGAHEFLSKFGGESPHHAAAGSAAR